MLNSIKQYFVSPHKMVVSPPSVPSLPLADNSVKVTKLTSSSSPSSAGTVSRKLIVSNMESVISSVKKQERIAKKKKRENIPKVNNEPEICDISNILSNSLNFVVSPVKVDDASGPDTISDGECEILPTSDTPPSNGIPDHVSPPKMTETTSPSLSTPRPQPIIDSHVKSTTKITTITSSVSSSRKAKTGSRSKKKVSPSNSSSKKPLSTSATSMTTPSPASTTTPMKNAFEFMMSARNKSIGTNSPGKDTASANNELPSPNPINNTKTKRKLMLEEWADRKGGAKRKMQDEETEQYVNRKMEKRAKRLKKLIQNGRKSKEDVVWDDVTEEEKPCEPEMLNSSFKFNFKKINEMKKESQQKKQKKRQRVVDSDEDVIMVGSTSKVEVNRSTESAKKYKPLELIVRRSGERKEECNRNSPKLAGNESIDMNSPAEKEDTATSTVTVKKSFTDNSFARKLSSPIKKKDSLLGYFNKIDKSPPVSDLILPETERSVDATLEIIPAKSVKKRGRPSKTKLYADPSPKPQREITPPPSSSSTTELPVTDLASTSTGRPKRCCRDKIISYKILVDCDASSPTKIAADKSLKRAKRLLSASPTKKSPNKLSHKQKQKWAPIFIKKPIIDPEIAKAKHAFLMSGIPEKMKLEIERQRVYEEVFGCSTQIFPLVSHVTQLSPRESVSSDLEFKLREVLPVDIEFKYSTFKCGGETQPFPESRKLAKRKIIKLKHPKKLVQMLKETDNSNFLYFRCYKQLLQKVAPNSNNDLDNSDLENVTKADVSNGSIEFIEETFNSINGTLSFTEKYRPMTSQEILVNAGSVQLLKKFLSSWQEANLGKRNASSSDDDFEMESNSSTSVVNSAVILIGPPGCGKTNAVYAVANELNFKVLEINAGGKRTGKKILQELQEATQSHRVKGNKSDVKTLRFAAINSSNEESNSSYSASGHSHKLSVILIEDADIVFEQDNGFIEAIYQLVASSKRPVILVANHENSDHLARFKTYNPIYFTPANTGQMSRWLSTLTIAERCYIDWEECARLYTHNAMDLRKTMHELQFFIQSGGDIQFNTEDPHQRHTSLYELFSRNQNQVSLVPYPIDFDVIREKSREILDIELNRESDLTIEDSLDYYSNMSFAHYVQKYSSNDDRMVNYLNEDVANEVVDLLMKKHKCVNVQGPAKKIAIIPRDLLSNNIYQGAGPTSYGLGAEARINKAISLDVEPCLRAICRSEKIRTQSERRSSRFYHYLRNAVTNSFSTELFDVHAMVFDDDH